MTGLVLLGMLCGLSMASLGALRRRPAPRLAAPVGRSSSSLASLRRGDAAVIAGRDYLVDAVVSLTAPATGAAALCRLADGHASRWLLARPGPAEPLLLDEVAGLLDGGGRAAAPEEVRLGGVTYRRVAATEARVSTTGSGPGLPQGERAWLSEYAGLGVRRLVALSSVDRTLVLCGEPLPPAALEVFSSGER